MFELADELARHDFYRSKLIHESNFFTQDQE